MGFSENVQAGTGTITITGYSGELSLTSFSFDVSH